MTPTQMPAPTRPKPVPAASAKSGSGSSRPTVATTLPTGPNVVSDDAHREGLGAAVVLGKAAEKRVVGDGCGGLSGQAGQGGVDVP